MRRVQPACLLYHAWAGAAARRDHGSAERI